MSSSKPADGGGQRARVLGGDQDAVGLGRDQLARAVRGGGDDGTAGGPGFQHHVAQRLVAGRTDQEFGRGQQCGGSAAPARQVQPVGDAFGFGRAPCRDGALRALAGDQDMDAGQRGHGADQDVERLVAVQTAQGEHERAPWRQASAAGAAFAMSGEKFGR